jgi:hypothetical protein
LSHGNLLFLLVRAECMSFPLQTLDKEQPFASTEGQEIDQVRKLLFGEQQSANDRRMAAVEQYMQQLQKVVVESMLQLSGQVARLGEELASSQRASFKELSVAVERMGQNIARVSLEAGPPVSNDQSPE